MFEHFVKRCNGNHIEADTPPSLSFLNHSNIVGILKEPQKGRRGEIKKRNINMIERNLSFGQMKMSQWKAYHMRSTTCGKTMHTQ